MQLIHIFFLNTILSARYQGLKFSFLHSGLYSEIFKWLLYVYTNIMYHLLDRLYYSDIRHIFHMSIRVFFTWIFSHINCTGEYDLYAFGLCAFLNISYCGTNANIHHRSMKKQHSLILLFKVCHFWCTFSWCTS